MKRFFACIFFLLLSVLLQAQFSVSPGGHYLLRDGKAFFWLGDTGWELFHRLTREDADKYFKRRSEQGFTVIQAVVLAEFDGLHTPNAYGELPLENDDPAHPREAYFKYVDELIDLAASYDLVIGLLPTWGDKVFKSTWGKGPEIFNPANAESYGRWIAERYRNKKNIVWILGGDRNPENETHLAIWRAMAKGIETGSGGGANALISFHPQPTEKGSAQWFAGDAWIDFHMFQNGHCRDVDSYHRINALYKTQPAKPVMDAEPIYEDHPVCFNVTDLGTSSAYDVRKFAYLELFAGSQGHTYGCHDIWQFYSPQREAVNGPHVYWQQAMDLPGANQMSYVKKLILSRPFLARVPDQTLILENELSPAEHIQATRGTDYLFVYTAAGKPFTVMLGKISGTTVNALWFNPRNGKTVSAGAIENKGKKKFIPPSTGYGQDWVFILDDASKHFEVP